MSAANDVIQNAYQSLVQNVVASTQVSIDPDSWMADTVDIIAPIISPMENLKKMIVAARAQADAMTDATTAAMLAQLDGARDS